ncbi:MAG: D-glycerate dehydrogenase [Pseudomonadales bacterium]
MTTVRLTRRWPEAVETRMAGLGQVTFNRNDQSLSRDQLAEALATADVLCPTVTDRLDADLLGVPGLRTRLIANFGVGYNHIDVDAARRAGVAVTNTPDVLTEATAEIALTLMLMSARRAAEGERLVRRGAWDGWRPTHMLSTQVAGKTLGIVGMGRIGTDLARKAHHGLGMRILYSNRHPVSAALESELAATGLDLPQLLQRSDFVSLNCPATPQTRHLIDAAALRLMPSHAHLVNTARGDVIDEDALVDALRQGVIAGAGLDVYESEPRLAPGLADLEQVVLLPHMGSGTLETREAMGFCALANVEAFIAGRPLPNPVVDRPGDQATDAPNPV